MSKRRAKHKHTRASIGAPPRPRPKPSTPSVPAASPAPPAAATARPSVAAALEESSHPGLLALPWGASLAIVAVVLMRLTEHHLGTSLGERTASAGAILVGIMLGHFVGGRLADWPRPRRTLALTVVCASVCCLLLPAWNTAVLEWESLWDLPRSARAAVHVGCVHGPAMFVLAVVHPLLMRIALAQNRGHGRAMGTLSAWTAVGGVAGAIWAGFLLIPRIGSAGTLCSVGGLLALCGIALTPRLVLSYLTAAAACGAVALTFARSPAAEFWAEALGLRPHRSAATIHQRESAYGLVRVAEDDDEHMRLLQVNGRVHGAAKPWNAAWLANDFERICAVVAERASPAGRDPRCLVLGGGSFGLVHHVLDRWPGARVDVVERDPAVTQAGRDHLGLPADARLRIIHNDARIFMRSLRSGPAADEPRYDVVCQDTAAGFVTPVHLLTLEHVQQVDRLLPPGGGYVLRVVADLDRGRMLGSALGTIGKVFPTVEVFLSAQAVAERTRRGSFVIVAGKDDFDVRSLKIEAARLDDDQVAQVKRHAAGLVLTDDHAPVDSQLAEMPADPTERTAEYVRRGREALEEDDSAGAAYCFRRAVEKDPSDVTALRLLSRALAQSGRPDEAALMLNKLLTQTPEDGGVLAELAAAQWSAGQIDSAVATYKRARAAAPEDARVNRAVGRFYVQRELYEPALRFLRTSITAEPDDVESLGLAGAALTRLKRYDEAETLLLHGVALDEYRRLARRWPSIYLELGEIAMARGRFDKAAAAFAAYIRTAPADASSHFALGVALRQLGRRSEAEAAYRRALRLAPQYADAHYNLGNLLLFDAGARDEAATHYRATIQARPDMAMAYVNLAHAEQTRPNTCGGIAILREGLAAVPGSAAIMRALAQVLAMGGDLSARDGPEAVRLAQAAASATNPQTAEMLYLVAAAYAQARTFDRAMQASAEARTLAQAAGDRALVAEIERSMVLYDHGLAWTPTPRTAEMNSATARSQDYGPIGSPARTGY